MRCAPRCESIPTPTNAGDPDVLVFRCVVALSAAYAIGASLAGLLSGSF